MMALPVSFINKDAIQFDADQFTDRGAWRVPVVNAEFGRFANAGLIHRRVVLGISRWWANA
ncbi:MAG: hypothetical protein K0U64_03030, partial [Actinomycetia bacterium]|nr:hypothetical protein [Actinomycetes bacterium]